MVWLLIDLLADILIAPFKPGVRGAQGTLYKRLSLLKGVFSKILTKRYKLIWVQRNRWYLGKEKNMQKQVLYN